MRYFLTVNIFVTYHGYLNLEHPTEAKQTVPRTLHTPESIEPLP